MNILMTGATGFIGSHLIGQLDAQGHSLIVLVHKYLPKLDKSRSIYQFDEIADDEVIDCVINLAGLPIDRRWTNRYKEKLFASRIDTTTKLVNFIKSRSIKPELFINASAIGYYGSQQDNVIDESASPVDCFTHKLCASWEQTVMPLADLGVRVCITRLGVVLGSGGLLKKLLPVFRAALGGQLGNGEQYFCWVHIKDVLRCFEFLIGNNDAQGVYNLVSPNPVTNRIFTTTLASAVKRPALFAMPSWLISILFGEMGRELLLGNYQVIPCRLQQQGFSFQYQTIDAALKDIIDEHA